MNNPTQILINRIASFPHERRLHAYTEQVAAMTGLQPMPLFGKVTLGQAYEVVCKALNSSNHLTTPAATKARRSIVESPTLTEQQIQSFSARSRAELRAGILKANKEYGLSIPADAPFEVFIETVHAHRLAHEPEYFERMQEARRQKLVSEFGLSEETGLSAAETAVTIEVNFAFFLRRSPTHFSAVEGSFPPALRKQLFATA